MQVRSLCLLTFALPSLAALALPAAVHDAPTVHGRRVRAAEDRRVEQIPSHSSSGGVGLLSWRMRSRSSSMSGPS